MQSNATATPPASSKSLNSPQPLNANKLAESDSKTPLNLPGPSNATKIASVSIPSMNLPGPSSAAKIPDPTHSVSIPPINLPGPSNATKLADPTASVSIPSMNLPGPSSAAKIADPTASISIPSMNLPGPSSAAKIADPTPSVSNNTLDLPDPSNSNYLSISRFDFNSLSKSANDLSLVNSSEFDRPSTLGCPLEHARSTSFLNSKLSQFLSKSIDSSNPSTSTRSSDPSSPSINLSIDRSYTYAGSSGITKPNVTGTRHGFYRISRRYSDSDESVVRTVIEDVNLEPCSESSFNSVKAIAGDDDLDIDQALFIRELSHSITMGPIIPGTQETKPTLTWVQDVSSEEI